MDHESDESTELSPLPPINVAVAEMEEVVASPRRSAAGIVAALLIVVVCAGATTVGAVTGKARWRSNLEILSSASALTTHAGSAHIDATANFTADGIPALAFTVSGDSNFGAKTGRLTMTVAGETEDIRSINGTAYLRMPFITLPRGAHWLSITAADVGQDPAASQAATQGDPTSGLQFLSAIAGDPRVVGNETLDGTAVTHYRFTVNLKSLADRLSRAGKKMNIGGLGDLSTALGSMTDMEHIPAEAWLDGQGRVRRFDYSMALSFDPHQGSIVLSMRFSNFGENVTVETPDPSDVVPFSEVPDILSGSSLGISGN